MIRTIYQKPVLKTQFTISDQLFLDVLLMEIRSKAIAYATMKKKTIRRRIRNQNSIDRTELDLDNLKANERLVDIR